LTSEVEFDSGTADFEAFFTKSDYDSHSQRFTVVDPNDPTISEVAMYFRSIIIVSGSSTNGATIADADQPAFADFKVTFVDPEQAATCADLEMALGDTHDGTTDRPYLNEYMVDLSSTAAENLNELTVYAKKIFPSVTGCPTKTSLQFLTNWGEWLDIRDGTEGMIVNTVEAVGSFKFITFKLSQDQFLDYATYYYSPVNVAMYDHATMDEEITEVTILARFYTEGPNGAFVEDFFEINVISSGETKADTCASEFATLSMAEAFVSAAPREY
jgi:hypothetical protein